MGWREKDIIPFIENKRKDGKIVDASGTKRIDQRPTMQEMVFYIQSDVVKAVMTRGIDRLFRHADMVEPAVFAKICKEHRCIIITDKYTYDFYNRPDDTKKFLAEAQAGADYITGHIAMMGEYKREKAMRGEYDGRGVPTGFLLDELRERYVIYEPHAEVVRWLYRRYRELGGNFSSLLREVYKKPYLFPFYPAGMTTPFTALGRNEHGYTITPQGLQTLLTNVAYIGMWDVCEKYTERLDDGKEVKRTRLLARLEHNHPAIVDEDDFWYAFNRLSPATIDGQKQERDNQRARHSRDGYEPHEARLSLPNQHRTG